MDIHSLLSKLTDYIFNHKKDWLNRAHPENRSFFMPKI